MGRRLWSLTKEKPRERTASLGRWWRVVFGEGGVFGNHCRLSLGGGKLRCCDWISSLWPTHLGVEGLGGFSGSPSGEVHNLTHAPFVLTPDIPKFLRLPPPPPPQPSQAWRVLMDRIQEARLLSTDCPLQCQCLSLPVCKIDDFTIHT